MDPFLFPTGNVLINTFLRSIFLILTMLFGFGTNLYAAYWGAIIHDTISLLYVHSYPLSAFSYKF